MKFWIVMILLILLVVALIAGIMHFNKQSMKRVQVGQCISIMTGRGGVAYATVIEKDNDTITIKLPIEAGFVNLQNVNSSYCNSK